MSDFCSKRNHPNKPGGGCLICDSEPAEAKAVREFWIQRTLVTEGSKVVERYKVQLNDEGLEADNYNHGDEYWHVIEKSAYDILIQALESAKAEIKRHKMCLAAIAQAALEEHDKK